MGSACKVRNLGELVEKPGRQKSGEGGEKHGGVGVCGGGGMGCDVL